MLLSQLVAELEELLDQNGDLVVELDSGRPVEEVDFSYPIDSANGVPAAHAEAIVIK